MEILYVAIAIIVVVDVVLFLFYFFLKSNKGTGWLGEMRVRSEIGKTVKGKKYVLNNVMIQEEGKTSQIDHIVINKNGVFVIETKNYAGAIYGREEQKEWMQVLKRGKMKNHFYNPVKQNATHIYRLSKLLPENTPLINVVVFIRSKIKHVSSLSAHKIKELKRVLENNNGKELTVLEMEKIYQCILESKNSIHVSNHQHVKEIKQMKKNIENNICPRCGSRLILRHGKNGDFYGCENYPKCKFTKKLQLK